MNQPMGIARLLAMRRRAFLVIEADAGMGSRHLCEYTKKPVPVHRVVIDTGDKDQVEPEMKARS